MSPVIKSADHEQRTRIRVLSLEQPPATPSPEALAFAELEAQLEAALDRETRLATEADRLRVEAEAAFARGRQVGIEDGRRLAEDRSAALLAELATAAAGATAAFRARLDGLEAAAAGLAGLALSRIADHPETRRDLVEGAVRRALAETAAGAVVRVEVSRNDFPDPSALAAAAEAAGAQVVPMDHPSGACRIILRLGEIDLGLDGQITRLRALMETGS